MDDTLEQLIKVLNKGKLHGATTNIGKLLGVSNVAIHNWFTGKATPSEENIKKIAKIANRSEKEIQKIFLQNSNIANTNSFNTIDTSDKREIELLKKEIELKNKEIELLKKEIELNKKNK